MDEEQSVLSHSSVGRQSLGCHEIQGAGKAGTPQNSLFASGISSYLSYTCALILRGREMEMLFSVSGRRSREAQFGINHF